MPVERNIQFTGCRISYRVLGAGPPVMLLHGLPFNGNLWNEQLKALSGFTFIVPDLPGSGGSEMIQDMTMEGMAEAMKAILDFEQESSVILIGHSMGGYTALAFAEKYPERLRGLGLFHSTAFPDSDERREARRKGIGFVNKNGAHEFLKTVIPNLFSPNSRDKIPSTIDEFISETNNFSAPSFVSYYEAMMQRPDRSAMLKTLSIPTLFVAGKYDNAAPLNDVLKLCHLPEISYFHVLAESGHMGMIEETAKSNSILNEYLINVL